MRLALPEAIIGGSCPGAQARTRPLRRSGDLHAVVEPIDRRQLRQGIAQLDQLVLSSLRQPAPVTRPMPMCSSYTRRATSGGPCHPATRPRRADAPAGRDADDRPCLAALAGSVAFAPLIEYSRDRICIIVRRSAALFHQTSPCARALATRPSSVALHPPIFYSLDFRVAGGRLQRRCEAVAPLSLSLAAYPAHARSKPTSSRRWCRLQISYFFLASRDALCSTSLSASASRNSS